LVKRKIKLDEHKIVKPLICMINKLSLIQYVSKNGSVMGNFMLTNFFIRALFDAGFSNNFTLLKKAKAWYDSNANDNKEFNLFLLEGLLIFNEEKEKYTIKQLNELKKHYTPEGRFDLTVGYSPHGDLFSTMFSLRTILYLKKPQAFFEKDQIDQSIKWLIDHRKEIKQLKDKLFPIYILSIYNKEFYKNEIENLLSEVWEKSNSVYKNLKKSISEGYKVDTNALEEVLWITCDLIPLYQTYPKIKLYIDDFVIFLENKLLNYLRPHYAENDDLEDNNLIYFKIRIFSLIITILSKYFGNELKKALSENLILEELAHNINSFLAIQEEKIKPFIDSIGKRLKIGIDEVLPISGGYSDSKIFRVKSEVNILVNMYNYKLPSLIFKISNTSTFRKEIINYCKIPGSLKQYFSKLTNPIFYSNLEDEKINIILIMEDLINYWTLNEIYEKIDFNKKLEYTNEEPINDLCKLLKHFYNSTLLKSKNTNLIFDLYLQDMFKSMSSLLKSKKFNLMFENFSKYFLQNLRHIMNIKDEFKPSISTIMHGDLNLRNIMIFNDSDDSRIKFIDIDNLRIKGDYAYDIGELIVDIFSKNISKSKSFVDSKGTISKKCPWITIIENIFYDYSSEIKDDTFEKRLNLSKIRSLLKLSKICLENENYGSLKRYIKQIISLLQKIRNKK